MPLFTMTKQLMKQSSPSMKDYSPFDGHNTLIPKPCLHTQTADMITDMFKHHHYETGCDPVDELSLLRSSNFPIMSA